MSGHSKWHSIRHKKALIDSRRGKVFTRIIREITIAARIGGGDVNANPRLRTAVAAAKEVNMPSKNIDSAIKKGSGDVDGANYEEITYEGYGPGGVAILVDTTTDNRNRTTGEVRHAFTKYHSSLGAVNSVAYLFAKKGYITVDRAGVNEDKLLEAALEAGAEDVKTDSDEVYIVVTGMGGLHEVRSRLEEAKFPILNAEFTYVPSMMKRVEGDDAATLVKMLNLLEEIDDVQSVSGNYEMDDEYMEQLQ